MQLGTTQVTHGAHQSMLRTERAFSNLAPAINTAYSGERSLRTVAIKSKRPGQALRAPGG